MTDMGLRLDIFHRDSSVGILAIHEPLILDKQPYRNFCDSRWHRDEKQTVFILHFSLLKSTIYLRSDNARLEDKATWDEEKYTKEEGGEDGDTWLKLSCCYVGTRKNMRGFIRIVGIAVIDSNFNFPYRTNYTDNQ